MEPNRNTPENIFQAGADLLGEIFASAREGMIVTQGGKIAQVNQRALKDSGYSHERVPSFNPFEFIHPQDREKAFQRAKRILKGKSSLEEGEYRLFTGREEFAGSKLTPWQSNGAEIGRS